MVVAIVDNNVIIEIKTITEDQYSSISCQLLVDITNEYPTPLVGWVFDGSKLIGPSISTKITRLAMRQRFTITELIGIYTAAKTNSFFQVLLDNLSTATFIDLKREDTVAAVNVLVSSGILTSDRALTILNTIPTDIEIYKGQ